MSGLRKLRQRTTWTSFHLPSTQPWPTWPSAAIPGEDQTQDPYLGVLAHVPGVENVRLARRVEDVEQAAFIVRKSYYPLYLSNPSHMQHLAPVSKSALNTRVEGDELFFLSLNHSLHFRPSTHLIMASKHSVELRRRTRRVPNILTLP